MKFNYELTKEDYIAYNIVATMAQNEYKKSRIIFTLMAIGWIIILVATVFSFFFFKDFDLKLFTGIFTLYLIWGTSRTLLYLIKPERTIRKRVEKKLKRDPSIWKNSKGVYEFCDGLFIDTVDTGEISKTPLKEIIFVKETENHIFLFMNILKGFIIPKKYIPSIEDFKKLLS